MPKRFIRPYWEPAALNVGDTPPALPVGAVFWTVEVVEA
jgi:hypothetical protein